MAEPLDLAVELGEFVREVAADPSGRPPHFGEVLAELGFISAVGHGLTARSDRRNGR